MAAKHTGCLAQKLVLKWLPSSLGNISYFHTGSVVEAARKGTRAKAEAKKKATKKVQIKREFIPLKKRLELQQTGGASPRRNEDLLKDPIDNVWFTKFFKWRVYSVRDAIAMHRETHHETQIGLPDAEINVYIELNMSADKKNRYIDNFSSVVRLPYDFETEQNRTTLVVSRNEDIIDRARQMGVTHATGLEIIKQVQNGEVNLHEYQHIIAETEILPDLIAIRGLMKKRFPSVRNGNAGVNIIPIIERFVKGVEYRTTTDKYHHDFATIEVPFGKLDMADDQLEENLASLLRDVENMRPQRKSDQLITLVCLRSPPSCEQFKIDHTPYFKEKSQQMKATAVA